MELEHVRVHSVVPLSWETPIIHNDLQPWVARILKRDTGRWPNPKLRKVSGPCY